MKKIGVVIVCWKEIENSNKILKLALSWKKTNPTIYFIQTETERDNFQNIEEKNVVKLFSKNNLGFSGSNNLGISKSLEDKNDFTLLINSDAFIDETELIKLIETAEIDPSIFSVGPIISESFKDTINDFVGGNNIAKNSNTRIKLEDINKPSGNLLEVFYNIGAIILFNNSNLQKVGLLDIDYFFSGEIADYCYRAKSFDLKSVTNLNAKGFHFTEDSQNRASLYKYYSLRNRCLFIKKNKLPFQYLLKWYQLIFKEMLHGIYIRDFTKAKTMAITFIDVILGKTGNRNSKFL